MDAQLTADRRVLLEHVLKDFAKRGGKLVLPRSTPFNDPSLLDSLNALAVLRAVSDTGSPLDLSRLAAGGPLAKGRPPLPAARLQPTAISPDGIPTYGGMSGLKLESGWSASNTGNDNPFASPEVSRGNSSADGANPFLTPAPAPQAWDRPSRGGATQGHRPSGSGDASVPLYQSPQQQAKPAHSAHTRTTSAPSFAAASQPHPDPDIDDSEENKDVIGSLQLPLLETGVSDTHLRELSYFIFTAACPGSQGPPAGSGPGSRGATDATSAMLAAVRGQLELDETSARDVASIMRHVATGYWTAARRCSTEGLMTVLAHSRANDFNMLGGAGRGFKSWSRWRATLGQVLGAAADLKHAALQRGPESRKLVARLRGALRRLDVRSADEFDEEEYTEAAAALKDATRGLAFCGLRNSTGGVSANGGTQASPQPHSSSGNGNGWATFDSPYPPVPPALSPTLSRVDSTFPDAASSGSGWKLPWALRARVAEALLTALFDTINEGSYIDDVAAVQAALDAHVWPALGVSPTLALALSAWVHFRQYIATGQAWLARQLKVLISKLSTAVASSRSQRGNTKARPELLSPLTPEDESEADLQVAAEVGRLVVDKLLDRLSDYHQHYPPGSEQSFQVLLDTTACAARARGDSEPQLAAMLLEVVAQAVTGHWKRLCTQRHDASNTREQTLLLTLAFAEEVSQVEAKTYTPLLQAYLPYQQALVACMLHRATGQHLLPWLRSGLNLDPDSVDVVRAAIILDSQLGGLVSEAQASITKLGLAAHAPGQPPATAAGVVADALRGFMRWELDVPVQLAMDKWVGRRVETMNTWVDRQLATEKWVAVNANDGYSQSSVEVIAMVLEAVEALFAMKLPVGQPALRALLSGIDVAMGRYAQHILGRVGSPARFIPPMPQVTRYKKPFTVKQEEVEAELLAASTPGLYTKTKSKGAMNAMREFGRNLVKPPKTSAGGDEQNAFLESVPPIQTHTEYTAMQSMTPAVIACYIMSAHYLTQKLEGLTANVRTRWKPPASGGASSAAYPPVPGDSGWVDGAFQGCRHQLQQVCQAACVFLATKVVFWDMRYGWLEQLYRHHVPSKSGSALQPPYSCRIDPLLDTLNQMLAEACGILPDALRALVATELLTAAATAWQRVLLDGGPCRWFIPADVAALREDLDSLQHLFEAEGEGLDRAAIEPILRPCRRLLLLVGCELSQLMSMLKTARVQGRATLQMAGREPEVFDEYVLMRTLARRPDRTGSKLLKKEYKMGRRLKT